MTTMKDIEINIRTELKPGDIGYLIHMHGRIYADECGYNHIFEGYVCKTFYEFLNDYDPVKDCFWLAEINGAMIGAIVVVNRGADKAQLRWFIVHPQYRRLGLGRRLFKSSIEFCRQNGYREVYLETTAEQQTAIKMYEKAGFKKIDERINPTWGKILVEQTYVMQID